MSTRRPVTPDERTSIVDAITAGGTCRGIATDFNRSTDTIRRIAADAGIIEPFARAMTERATEARRADNQARRADLAAGMLDDAHRMRLELFGEAEYVSVTREGAVVRYTTERPTFADQRNVAVAVKVLADGASALERVDRDAGDHSAVDGWLRHIIGQAGAPHGG